MIRKGTLVEWNWASGSATGKVKEVIKEEVSRSIKGSTITRKGSEDNPALLIEQEDGGEVLKLQSEIKRAD